MADIARVEVEKAGIADKVKIVEVPINKVTAEDTIDTTNVVTDAVTDITFQLAKICKIHVFFHLRQHSISMQLAGDIYNALIHFKEIKPDEMVLLLSSHPQTGVIRPIVFWHESNQQVNLDFDVEKIFLEAYEIAREDKGPKISFEIIFKDPTTIERLIFYKFPLCEFEPLPKGRPTFLPLLRGYSKKPF